MKVIEARKVLSWMSDDVEVELVFPDVNKVNVKPRKPQLTEGEMAMLPMYPKDDHPVSYHASYHGG